jgi:hypothetical protein
MLSAVSIYMTMVVTPSVIVLTIVVLSGVAPTDNQYEFGLSLPVENTLAYLTFSEHLKATLEVLIQH